MRSLTLLMVVFGCSEGGKNMGGPDMAMKPCTPSGAEVCDGKDNDCNGQIDEKTPATNNQTQFVASAIELPMARTDYAIDLNGDMRLDNQLSALVNVLKSQGTDANAQVQFGITNGDQIMLIERHSADATYQSDPCASAKIQTGEVHPMPVLTGGGSFVVDTTVPSGSFTGAITAGTFESVLPTEQVTPVTLTLNLVMFPGRVLALPLVGAHVRIKRDSATKISGEIHGAIRHDDVESKILPTFAAQIQEQVTTMPMAASSMQLLAFFDDGGNAEADMSCGRYCRNLDLSCAVPGDGKIDTCEVTSNTLVQGVVANDVQMFSEDGKTYMPSAANTHKDSLSFGIAFTAFDATF